MRLVLDQLTRPACVFITFPEPFPACLSRFCLPCQDVKDLVVILITQDGIVILWQSFGDLGLDPLVHHLQSPIAAASVYCHAKQSSWQAAVALQSSAILLLKAAWQLSAIQTVSIGSLCKSIEVRGQLLTWPAGREISSGCAVFFKSHRHIWTFCFRRLKSVHAHFREAA